MAGLHAVGLEAGAGALLAEGALADPALLLVVVAGAVGACVGAHLAAHALSGLNPDDAVCVLAGCAGGAGGNACGLCAVHADQRGEVQVDVGPLANSTLGNNRVVDDVDGKLVPGAACDGAGVAANAATRVHDHCVAGHVRPPLLPRQPPRRPPHRGCRRR